MPAFSTIFRCPLFLVEGYHLPLSVFSLVFFRFLLRPQLVFLLLFRIPLHLQCHTRHQRPGVQEVSIQGHEAPALFGPSPPPRRVPAPSVVLLSLPSSPSSFSVFRLPYCRYPTPLPSPTTAMGRAACPYYPHHPRSGRSDSSGECWCQ